MKFGCVAVATSEGAILAHAVKRPGLALRKGAVVGFDEVAALKEAGVETVVAARLEAEDVHEDNAAQQLAAHIAGPLIVLERPFTGRCNLLARAAGLVQVDGPAIDAINAVDEAITVATLPPLQPVVAGEMVGTIKIIPFSVPARSLDRAMQGAGAPALRVLPYKPLRVGVVSTLLPGLKAAVVGKTLQVLEARLAPAGAAITKEVRTRHEADAVAAAIEQAAQSGVDLIVIFGASAITDRRDIVPAAIGKAGGAVFHLGMPVDPGNLLLLGAMPTPGGSVPVIGAPGCARSPKENGFDFVLRRLLVGLEVTGADLRRLGVGGLLGEIASRPQPRGPTNG